MRPILALAVAGLAQAGPLFAQAAVQEPSYDGRTLSQWVAALDGEAFADRAEAQNAIKFIGRPAAPVLIGIVTGHRNEITRILAAGILGRIGGIGTAAALERVAKTDADLDVQVTAAGSLADMASKGDADASAAVSTLVRQQVAALPDASRTSHAIRVLQAIGEPGRAALTEAALVHPDPEARVDAVSALESLGKGVVPTLVKALADPAPTVRFAAANNLGLIGTRDDPEKRDPEITSAVPALAQATKDPDAHVRQYAAEALGKIGVPARPAIPALKALLEDGDATVRATAREALRALEPR